MRRPLSPALALLVLVLVACAPTGSGSIPPGLSQAPTTEASTAPCQPTPAPGASTAPGCLPPGPSTAVSPAGSSSPGAAPIGTWSLTLGGLPPVAGDYGGSDEMICTALEGGPWAVSFNPVGADPIGHVDAVIDQEGNESLLISAGGVESGGTYVAGDATLGSSADVLEGPTVVNNVLHLKMHGVDLLKRTIDLTVDCPLFPGGGG
jgi:hypothetical protein